MGRRPHEPAPSPSEQARAEHALSAKQRSSFGYVGHVGLGKVRADVATPGPTTATTRASRIVGVAFSSQTSTRAGAKLARPEAVMVRTPPAPPPAAPLVRCELFGQHYKFYSDPSAAGAPRRRA